MAAKWGRPAGLGMWPRGHRPLESGSNLLLKEVDSGLRCMGARARPTGLGEAGWPPSGSSQSSVALMLHLYSCDLPGRWIADLDVALC